MWIQAGDYLGVTCPNLQVRVNVEEDDLIRKNQKKNFLSKGFLVARMKHLAWWLMSSYHIFLTIYSWERDKLWHCQVRQLEKCLDKFNSGLHNIWFSKECTAQPQNLSKVNVGVFCSQLSCVVFAKGCIRVCFWSETPGHRSPLLEARHFYSWLIVSDVYNWSVSVVQHWHTQ